MKQAGIYGGVLALALVGSYLTWTAPPEDGARTDVIALRASEADLESITWKDDEKTIVLTRPSDERGDYFWLESEERHTIEPPEADDAEETEADDAEETEADDAEETEADADADEATDADDTPEVEPEVEIERVAFAGNEQAEGIWEAFTPLHALRELQPAADGDLEPWGLDDPDTTLTVKVGGRDVLVELGGESYGTRDRYARIDGKVFLLDDKDVRPLQFATTRMVQRALTPFEEAQLRRVVVKRGDDTLVLVQQNADDRAKAFWARADTPDDKDVEAATWIGKLGRLRVRGYETPEEAGDLEAVFAYEVTGDDDTSWPVTIFRDAEGGYHARAAWNRSLVELTKSLAEEPVADLDTLFDGPSPDEAEEPAVAPEGEAPDAE